MVKISAIINTRNEEHNIRYCLETLRWCDEIIVVDMESEDQTIEIARQFTDKIYTHKRVIAFDIARKYAIEKASGNWILLIDADEMITKGLSLQLQSIAKNDSADIVYMPFKTYIMGAWIKHTKWWPQYHPRFFKSNNISFVETLHNYIKESPSTRKLYLDPVEHNAIVHFNYRDASHFIDKLNNYTTIEAMQMYENNEKYTLRRLIRRTWNEFFTRYITSKGYKDGCRGLFLSAMMGFYRFMTVVKLWELHEKSSNSGFDYVEYRNSIIAEFDSRKMNSIE